MARIENHKYSIEEAFRECFYIVPDYQREYVWTDKEVHQLLEDIGEQIDAGTTREYFIGTVLVSPTDQKNHYEVIDGQQRLTTFFLLLCALKHLFQGEPQRQMIAGLISTSYVDSDGEVCTTLKLEPRYESAGEVMAKLVELDAEPMAVRAGIQASGIASFGSLENLVNAYSTLYRYLKDNYDDTAKLKKSSNRLWRRRYAPGPVRRHRVGGAACGAPQRSRPAGGAWTRLHAPIAASGVAGAGRAPGQRRLRRPRHLPAAFVRQRPWRRQSA